MREGNRIEIAEQGSREEHLDFKERLQYGERIGKRRTGGRGRNNKERETGKIKEWRNVTLSHKYRAVKRH